MPQIDIVLKNSGIYLIVRILGGAIGFLLLPIYTIYLSPTDYGTVGVVTSITGFLSIFYILSLDAAIQRFYFDYKDDKEKIKDLFGTITVFILIISFSLSVFFFIFHKIVFNSIARGIDFYPFIVLGLISITFIPPYNLYQATLQIQQKGAKSGFISLSYFIILLSLNIIFVVIFKLKAVGILLSSAITSVVFFIFALIKFIPDSKFIINKKILYGSLKYCLPLLPHAASKWTMAMIDRLFLNNMKTTAVVGLYNVGFQIGQIIDIIASAINLAFVPWIFENLKTGGDKDKNNIIKYAEFGVVLYCVLGLGISFFGLEIVKIMVAKDFQESWKIIPFITFAFVFQAIYLLVVNPIFFKKNCTKYISIVTILCALINVSMNYVLIPAYGIIGASIASLISMIFKSIFMLYLSYKLVRIRYKWKKMYFTAFLFFSLSLLIFLSNKLNFYEFLLIKLFVFIIIIIIVYFIYKSVIKLFVSLVSQKIKLRFLKFR